MKISVPAVLATHFGRIFIVCALFASPVAAEDIELLPTCSPGVASAQQWDSYTYPFVRDSVFVGDVDFAELYNVGKGLLFGCASQLRMELRQVSVGNGTQWISDHLVPLPGITSTVSVVDAGQGDGIIVGLTFAAPSTTFWPECFPGSSFSSDSLCKSGQYPPASTGVMMFRLRDNNGAFTGKWTVSSTSTTPGFVLRRLTECPPNSQYCPYEAIFRRGTNGLPTVPRDAQVILQMNVNLPVTETGGAFNSNVAIPLFMRQSGATSTATPTPTPGSQSVCVVPKVKGSRLKKATGLLQANGCTLGKVTRKKSTTISKGKVIKAAAKKNEVRAFLAAVDLIVSKGR